MFTSPFTARVALAGFLIMGAAIATNILALQDKTVASAAERAKLERAQQRASAERNRRLALSPKEGSDAKETRVQAATAVPQLPIASGESSAKHQINRVGRLSPGLRTEPAHQEAETDHPQDTIRQVQHRLVALGYEPGANDGVTGLVTRAAIIAYEHDNGLPLTGEPSVPLLRVMQGAPGAKDAHVNHARQTRLPHAEQVLRTVQQSLTGLGYFTSKVDGKPGEETQRAIREYEMDHGLVPTGRVSAQLLNRISRATMGQKSPAPRSPLR